MADGKTLPFGDAGKASGGKGVDMTKDPQGGFAKPKIVDPLTEGFGPQKSGGTDPNPKSIPAGGKVPFKGPSEPTHKPFKVGK